MAGAPAGVVSAFAEPSTPPPPPSPPKQRGGGEVWEKGSSWLFRVVHQWCGFGGGLRAGSGGEGGVQPNTEAPPPPSPCVREGIIVPPPPVAKAAPKSQNLTETTARVAPTRADNQMAGRRQPPTRDALEEKEAAPEKVRQAVGGGCQKRLGAVTVGYKCH